MGSTVNSFALMSSTMYKPYGFSLLRIRAEVRILWSSTFSKVVRDVFFSLKILMSISLVQISSGIYIAESGLLLNEALKLVIIQYKY